MLNLFPEGCTTNGSSMVKFKKGAFFNLRPVRPAVLKYYSPGISPTQDSAGFLYHTLLTTMCIFIRIDLVILPVFAPNDYFWKNHWDSSKEEKWEAFARVTREIMAKEWGGPVSDHSMEDKFEYKEILKQRAKKGKGSSKLE